MRGRRGARTWRKRTNSRRRPRPLWVPSHHHIKLRHRSASTPTRPGRRCVWVSAALGFALFAVAVVDVSPAPQATIIITTGLLDAPLGLEDVQYRPHFSRCPPSVGCGSRPGASRLFSTRPSRADHVLYISDVCCGVLHSVLVSAFPTSPAANMPAIPTRLLPCPPILPGRRSIASIRVVYSTYFASTLLIPP